MPPDASSQPLIAPVEPTLADLDQAARAGLAALLAGLPAQPSAAALVLRMPKGVVVVPVGKLGDVLAALEAGRNTVFGDGVGRVTYQLDPPAGA